MKKLLMPNPKNKQEVSDAKHFKENIREYNTSFAFASIVTDLKTPAGGAFIYKIQGTIYHQLAPCYVDKNKYKPQAIQYYFLDGDEANKERLATAKRENKILQEKVSIILHM